MKRLSIVIILLFVAHAQAQNTAAPTPPMGSDNWYWEFEQHQPSIRPTEAIMKAQADAMVSTGLAVLGYKYVIVDAGWNQRTGGLQVGIPAQFPSGIPALADYIHGKGLLFGLYSSPNTNTCSGDSGVFPGSLGFEATDANTFFNVMHADYLKYDFCSVDQIHDPNEQANYQTMGNMLVGLDHPVAYDISTKDETPPIPPTYFEAVQGTNVLTAIDIGEVTMDQRLYVDDWAALRPYQNKGHWLNPDMLMCGLNVNMPGYSGPGTPVTDVQCRTQFSHYAILAAPLIIATDLAAMSASTLATYSNAEVIAVNQDSLGVMGFRVSQTACGSTFCEVWARQLHDGWAVELINRDTAVAHSITVSWSSFGLSGNQNMRDLWSHAYIGSSSSGYTAVAAPSYNAIMLKLTPVAAHTGAQGGRINGNTRIQ
jgi:alpha-galactosidase